MTTRKIIQRSVTGVVAAAALSTVWAPTPASAAVADPVLYGTVVSDYQAPCSYSASLQWDRAASRLTGSAWVQNHMWFEACRKKVQVTLVDDENHTAVTAEIVLETACGTTDPTCPSALNTPINQILPVSRYVKPYIDHMDAAITDRPR
ncbi:hypothetical protein ACFYRC_34180 [Streptomyces sp. NPDC005279]|uniref:hypothetical protein n=1 Tax=Streptomyces sp. NPDC005279 TaxID=3364712 RepID=UPI0036CE66D1